MPVNESKNLEHLSHLSKDTAKFVARQAVLDQQQKVYGYELLFRSGFENSFDASIPNPTFSVISDGVLFHDLNKLADNCKLFINFSREALLADYASLLPREFTIIEILESVEPDAEVLAKLHHLKKAGYSLTLDDVTSADRLEPFLDLVHFAKVDLSLTSSSQQQELSEFLILNGIRPIAEKVETKEKFHEVMSMGYQLFQGYFFATPEIVTGRDIQAFKLNYLRLLEAIHRPSLDLKELERLIKCEEVFCYKLLRYLNSPVFGFKSAIRSMRHAISLLGEKEVKRWTSMLAVTTLAGDKPQALVLTSLRRAFFCELLAPSLGMTSQRDNLFLLGLLSLIDTILDRPRAEILSQLPIDNDIKAALLEGNTKMAFTLQLVEAYDKAGWPQVADLAKTLRLSDRVVLSAYLNSVKMSHEALKLS